MVALGIVHLYSPRCLFLVSQRIYMISQRDEILAKELSKIGRTSGMIGGMIGGALGGSLSGAAGGAIGGAKGGAAGALFSARFLPTEQYQQEIKLSLDAATVLSKILSFFETEGRIANDSEAGTSQYPKISGILGSGFFKKNPTLVQAEVVNFTNDSCTLLISGAAKEGLIKQQSAQKAVTRITQFITMND